MKIKIPPILGVLDLAEYAKELEGQTMSVWLNVDREALQSYWVQLAKAKANKDSVDQQRLVPEADRDQQLLSNAAAELDAFLVKQDEFLALVWSKGPEPWSQADVAEFRTASTSGDPALFSWLVNKTLALISEHRRHATKKA